MSEPHVIAAFVVELLSDGTMRHVGFEAHPIAVVNGDVTQRTPVKAPETIADAMNVIIGAMGPVEVLSVSDPLIEAIKAASTVGDLTRLYRDNKNDWTAEHNEAAATRKKEINASDSF